MDKKKIKQIVALVAVAAVVALLAAMPVIAKQEPEENGPKASILSAAVSAGSVNRELIGGGTLAEEEAISISVPSGVKLTEFLVANGDAEFKAYIIRGGKAEEITLGMAALTEDEKNIILAGCLMNYWKN